MKVKKENLLIIASLVWLAAGFNILRIGIKSYTGYVTILNLFLSAVVFLIFWFMVFYKLTVKHTDRIQKYEEELQFFLKFFDIKSFCIMAFMMILGFQSVHLTLRRMYLSLFFIQDSAPPYLGPAFCSAAITISINSIKKP